MKSCWQVPGRHIVFRKERNLENLCAGDDNFLACRSDSFSCYAVNLVECVRPQITVICCPDEHLQVHWLLIVANKLLKKREEVSQFHCFISMKIKKVNCG